MQNQDSERAARSLDQAGVSTSTQMTVNMKTDLGGEEDGSLQAQCRLNAAQQQASLLKVFCPTPSQSLNLGWYLQCIGIWDKPAVRALQSMLCSGAGIGILACVLKVSAGNAHDCTQPDFSTLL